MVELAGLESHTVSPLACSGHVPYSAALPAPVQTIWPLSLLLCNLGGGQGFERAHIQWGAFLCGPSSKIALQYLVVLSALNPMHALLGVVRPQLSI